MALTDWYLTAEERDNPDTRLDRRHPDGLAWSDGNLARPLIHGASYFADLVQRVNAMLRGDLLLFTDWRGDPDELMTDDGPTVSGLLEAAAERGVDVRGLVWRSHLDHLQFSQAENRHLGEEIEAAGGEVLLDMRVRPVGSHHQKFVVLRHPGRPALDIAYVGGIDLSHSRRDTAEHRGDPQKQPMSKVYGSRPPWHDMQVALQGPVVGDVETVFRERWEDQAPLSRNPLQMLLDLARGDDTHPKELPPQLPDPPPCGPHAVQLLRTYPNRLGKGYAFASQGERSVARGYTKAILRARRLVYVEDQYLWSDEVARTFADALTSNPNLYLIAVLPHCPDQDGLAEPANFVGRERAVRAITEAGGERVALFGVENHAGTPVYVHAKVCIVDDVWATIGSDNFNRRSWTNDSELSAAVLDATRDARDPADPAGFGDGARTFARGLRLMLAREHLDRAEGDDVDLVDPTSAFDAFATSAAALQAWWDGGRRGTRPPGRLRPLRDPMLPRSTRLWATPLYHRLYDPDGRPRRMRRAGRF
ncbi:MAG: phospholipase D-like domain-containing protein [Candidatus Nanopelagicales bacterium]